MRREEAKRRLAPIREGTFVLCVNSRDCKWAIYQSKIEGTDHHCVDQQVVFTGDPYELPDHLAPIRYSAFHFQVQSNQYDYDIEAIHLTSIRAIYQTEDEVLHVAALLRAEEQGFVDAIEPFRARFAVFAKLVAD
jgi:hypothetical protein